MEAKNFGSVFSLKLIHPSVENLSLTHWEMRFEICLTHSGPWIPGLVPDLRLIIMMPDQMLGKFGKRVYFSSFDWEPSFCKKTCLSHWLPQSSSRTLETCQDTKMRGINVDRQGRSNKCDTERCNELYFLHRLFILACLLVSERRKSHIAALRCVLLSWCPPLPLPHWATSLGPTRLASSKGAWILTKRSVTTQLTMWTFRPVYLSSVYAEVKNERGWVCMLHSFILPLPRAVTTCRLSHSLVVRTNKSIWRECDGTHTLIHFALYCVSLVCGGIRPPLTFPLLSVLFIWLSTSSP